MAIWPFADVDPTDAGFVAIQQLALRRLLPLDAHDTEFHPNQRVGETWLNEVFARVAAAGYTRQEEPSWPVPTTRRAAAIEVWKAVANQPMRLPPRKSPDDADGDGIADAADPLPWTPGTVSWHAPPDTISSDKM